MKKVIILLIAALPFLGTAQVKMSEDFNVDVGRPYLVVDAPLKEYFYHNDEVLAIKIGKLFTVQKLSALSLDEQSRSSIVRKKELPRGYVHEDFVQDGEKIFEFYNVWDKPNKTEQIFVQEVSFSDPKPKNSKMLFNVAGKLSNYGGGNKIDLYGSFDRSKILLVYRKKPTEKRDKLNYDKIGMIVYDRDMNEIWAKEVKMPYTEAEMDNLGYTLDSKGNAYLLARVRNGEDAHLELFKYSSSDDPDKISIEAGNKHFPHGITLKEGDAGKIYCAGFYGEGSSANGIYLSIIETNGTVSNEKFYDIPLEIINKNKSDRAQSKNEKKEDKGKEVGIYKLDLDDIIVNADGSLALVGEVYYMRVTTSYNASTKSTTTTYHYYYQEMFMCKISSSGEMLWMQKLPKNQYRKSTNSYSTNNYDLSYRYMEKNGSHYLLYLDNVKNMHLGLNEYPARHMSGKGGYLTAYKIDDTSGDVSKLSLFDMKDVNGIAVYQFSTDRIIKASEEEVLLELYKKKKEDILIRIAIQD
jgi:hypothetical protein